jgi:hypothetical protein
MTNMNHFEKVWRRHHDLFSHSEYRILSTVMSHNQFSLEWCPWSTKSSYILNAREINVHYISGFIHGAIIIIPSGFIIYAKTLIYLGVHHPNKYEKKAARLWLRERYILLRKFDVVTMACLAIRNTVVTND